MEILLNALWLALALVSFGLWRACWSRLPGDRRPRRGQVYSTVGLSCALLLLFPVISLTDDLHAVPAVAEEARSPRRTLQNCKGSQTDPDPDEHQGPSTHGVLPRMFFLSSVFVGRLVPTDAPSPLTAANRPSQGRAPPARLS